MGQRDILEPPGRIIHVHGSRLHLNIAGSGRPVVVLEAGIAATSLSWALVQPEIAKLTTAVSYDRGGLGSSGPARSPRTPGAIAGELREALHAAGLSPPFLLVGHSFGGLIVQRFATLYRPDVLGLVLVDALRPGEWWPLTAQRERLLAQGVRLSRRGAVLARWGIVGASLRMLLAGNRLAPRLAARLSSGGHGSGFIDRIAGEIRKLPRGLWPVIARHWSQAQSFEGMAQHLESLPESAAELAVCEWDTALPVTALLAGSANGTGLPGWWKIQRAERSGHWLQLDRPDLVIAAVREMISQIG